MIEARPTTGIRDPNLGDIELHDAGDGPSHASESQAPGEPGLAIGLTPKP
jgi:hypothetical protein